MIWNGKLGQHKVLELAILNRMIAGSQAFGFNIDLRLTGDHPGLFIWLSVYHWTVIELNFYDTRHEEEIQHD